MKAYLDSSAIVKLVRTESGHEQMVEFAGDADLLVSAAIAYPESRSAIARMFDRRPRELRAARTELDAFWARLAVLPIDEERGRSAGDIAEAHRLRGMDAVHVAAALEMASEVSPLIFASWDSDQRDAAVREGLEVFPTRL